jgi:hypothetical protein
MTQATKTAIQPDNAYKLTLKTIGQIRGHFFVPGYQRGYRWDRNDVTRLLDDIWESNGQDYSLQPVVLKLYKQGENLSDHEWELIDGQQRLTTLYLILNYIQKQGWRKNGTQYSLSYETRPGSQTYLGVLDEATHNTNIDYYHLYKANQYIGEWFQKHGDEFNQEEAANTFHRYLSTSVHVIWYEAPEDTDSTALFTRLNVGRIPLTDAELIKAALLSKVRSKLAAEDRDHEIAAQWDNIERDLHHGDIWAFVTGQTISEGIEKYPTRISLLLDTLADEKVKPIGKRPRYHTFDTLRGEIELDYSAFWKKLLAQHAQILGWVEQPKIYNKIGFLIASGVSFGEFAHQAKGKRKSEFESFLVNRIRDHIQVKGSNLEELKYDKKQGYDKLLTILLLMNVETTTQSGLRFPFARHIEQKWSLEHIHAQNAEALNRADQWKTWLTTHKIALDAVVSNDNTMEIERIKGGIDVAITNIDAGKSGNFSGQKFDAISSSVLKMLNRDGELDHSIRNMSLLSSSDNSRLNNSVFEVKRRMILKLDRKGSYVPVCTRNVFLKYYAEADEQQPHFWSETDKNSYIQEIRNRLKPYFISEESEQ